MLTNTAVRYVFYTNTSKPVKPGVRSEKMRRYFWKIAEAYKCTEPKLTNCCKQKEKHYLSERDLVYMFDREGLATFLSSWIKEVDVNIKNLQYHLLLGIVYHYKNFGIF